jgi:hypothetical protein
MHNSKIGVRIVAHTLNLSVIYILYTHVYYTVTILKNLKCLVNILIKSTSPYHIWYSYRISSFSRLAYSFLSCSHIMDDRAAQDLVDVDVDVIPNSMCVHCGGCGTTRMLVHRVPYFRELIIASFQCEWSPDDERDEGEDEDEGEDDEDDVGNPRFGCGYRNNEVTFGGRIQDSGCRYELKVCDRRDLDRQVIKSEFASFTIPEIDFEIPAGTLKGEISTIEGFISRAAKVR